MSGNVVFSSILRYPSRTCLDQMNGVNSLCIHVRILCKVDAPESIDFPWGMSDSHSILDVIKA